MPFQSGLGRSDRSSFASLVFNRNDYPLSALTLETGPFLGCHLSVVEGKPKRYSGQRVKMPK